MIRAKVKPIAVDHAELGQAVRAGSRAALNKAGAFVRTTAINSIKSRRKSRRKAALSQSKRAKAKRAKKRLKKSSDRISKPGNPPLNHTGVLKKSIRFAFDRVTNSVLIGPVPRKGGKGGELLEFGGDVFRKGRSQNYAARPFMGPALIKEVGKMVGLFHDSIKRQGS